MAVGATAIGIGVAGGSLVLIAFGAIGLLDAAGSATLAVHFRHALRHEAISERHERLALRVVTLGMATIGVATVVGSAYRIAAGSGNKPVVVGVVLAGVSVLVLALLARRKYHIAPRIPSHALRADGWLSACGALLALTTLLGTGLQAAFGWWWLDPVSAIGVACGAVGLSVALAKGELRSSPLTSSP
jgi:divalent metal cation (Fe/Co/Zn/Cd) transporter